jgi:hypothetical protein
MTSKLKNDLKELHDDSPRMIDWRPWVPMPRGAIPTCRGIEAVPEPEHIWKAFFHITKVQNESAEKVVQDTSC